MEMEANGSEWKRMKLENDGGKIAAHLLSQSNRSGEVVGNCEGALRRFFSLTRNSETCYGRAWNPTKFVNSAINFPPKIPFVSFARKGFAAKANTNSNKILAPRAQRDHTKLSQPSCSHPRE